MCARLSPPPALALSFSLHRHPYLYIPSSSRFIRCNQHNAPYQHNERKNCQTNRAASGLEVCFQPIVTCRSSFTQRGKYQFLFPQVSQSVGPVFIFPFVRQAGGRLSFSCRQVLSRGNWGNIKSIVELLWRQSSIIELLWRFNRLL